MTQTLTMKTLKPRNPWVAASFRASAGAHRNNKQRQQAQRALRTELARLDHERHHS
jgi:hypothetical protein